jgi:hypothetical protein
VTLNQEQGSNADTGSDNFTPSTAPKPLSGSPIQQIARLKDYLATSWPKAAAPGEHAGDTAIRLLTGLNAASNIVLGDGPAISATRCSEQYCNQPAGHEDEHGWVNYQ